MNSADRTVVQSPPSKAKLNFAVKGTYAFADLTFSLMVQLTNAYALLFLTDVTLFSPAVAGSILFVGRILDAISPPFVGSMIEKSNLKWGKYRPWLVIGAVFTLIFDVILFISWNPQTGGNFKAVICCLVYALFCISTNVLYTGFTSMNSALTSDAKERVQLSTLRVAGGSVGKVIAGYLTLPMIAFLGSGGDLTQQGFFYTALVTSTILVIGYTLLAKSTKQLDVQQHAAPGAAKPQSLTMGESIRFVVTNRPLISLFVADVLRLLTYLVTLSMFPFFFIYVAKDPGATSMLMGTTAIAMFIGAILVPVLTKALPKKTVYLIGLSALATSFLLAWLFKDTTLLMVGVLVLGFVGYAFGSTITTAMYADIVDYGEVKYGKNARALYYSMFQLSIKVAAIFSTGISGFGLAAIGYVAGTEPTAQVISGINFICLALPIGLAVLAIVSLMFYNLSNKKMEEIRAQLAQKHA